VPTHVGVEIELDAERRRDVDPALLAGRVVEVRDRSENDGVHLPRALENSFRQGGAVLLQRDQADFTLFKREIELVTAICCLENGKSRLSDFRPDAVSRKNEQLHVNPVECLPP
jgi:hypothetical protein